MIQKQYITLCDPHIDAKSWIPTLNEIQTSSRLDLSRAQAGFQEGQEILVGTSIPKMYANTKFESSISYNIGDLK